ncbi:MAG: D-alanyl-D-alanine carboxypeptidase/D-alanyl-D-alanine-endopeptidase [Melioribacteraceae bacterium]|nr:D-alanyl-D-alanine carboxypeptidase/D-alanyl-D-alanine-endopeptidase [Melioribacteraceae bacterium]
MASLVEEINKNSNNFYSEQLLKTLGFEIYGYGNRENGIRAVKSILDKMGINQENISIADGSGLSFYNLITPSQITKLLAYMYKSDEFESFYNSLSLAGFSGTLAQRMNRTDAENNFRGKSGYLKNARALAGYIKTADGEPLVVSLIVNNFLVPSQLANYIQDKVCNTLANFTRN